MFQNPFFLMACAVFCSLCAGLGINAADKLWAAGLENYAVLFYLGAVVEMAIAGWFGWLAGRAYGRRTG